MNYPKMTLLENKNMMFNRKHFFFTTFCRNSPSMKKWKIKLY